MKDYPVMQCGGKVGHPYLWLNDGYSSRLGEAGNSTSGHSREKGRPTKCGLTCLVLDLLSLLHHPETRNMVSHRPSLDPI